MNKHAIYDNNTNTTLYVIMNTHPRYGSRYTPVYASMRTRARHDHTFTKICVSLQKYVWYVHSQKYVWCVYTHQMHDNNTYKTVHMCVHTQYSTTRVRLYMWVCVHTSCRTTTHIWQYTWVFVNTSYTTSQIQKQVNMLHTGQNIYKHIHEYVYTLNARQILYTRQYIKIYGHSQYTTTHVRLYMWVCVHTWCRTTTHIRQHM